MLVILRENVAYLGSLGEVVKVKPGYARNFLFPKKKAMKATKENLAKLEKDRLFLEEENTKKLNAARILASSLRGRSITLIKQASEDGRIFGSVTTREIAKTLSQEGYDISHHNLSFGSINIKNLGEYQVNIDLHNEVIVPVSVHVVRSEKDPHQFKTSKIKNQKSERQEDINNE